MSTRSHGCPALQVAHPRRPLPWRTEDLARERRHSRRYRNALATPQAPRAMAHLIIEPERAIDRLRHPVQHNVREQGIFTYPTLDITVTVCPGIKLFDNPGGQPGWGVVQGVCQRLRPGALNPLVASFLSTPGVRLGDKRLFSRRQVGAFTRVRRHWYQVQVDTDQMLRVRIPQAPGNKRSPITPLRAKAGQTEDVGHQALQQL